MNTSTARRSGARHPLDHDPAALRRRRVERGLSQARLANLAAISPGTLSELEGGTRNPSPEVLKRLADALDCPTAALMPRTAATP